MSISKIPTFNDEVDELIESIDLGSARRLWTDLVHDERPEGLTVDRIGRYTVFDRLGAGGGGEVFHAMDGGPGEQSVAVKWLRRPISDERARQRAWREMDVVSDLNLACVPRLRDFGIHEGRPYFAFDYVDGRPADIYCDEEKLTLTQRVDLLRKIALAAHELHQHGLIHRDLKPSNILITKSGAPRIIDFGIAAAAEADTRGDLTIEGVPMGSPSYMAPEQARGEHATVLSDVYALGSLACHLLAGEPPHQFEEGVSAIGAVAQVGSQPGRHPAEIQPDLPVSIAAVIAKATSFEAEARYESAHALAEDLERFVQGDPVRAQRPRIWRTALAWGRHNRVAAIFLLIAIVGLTATASIGSFTAGRIRMHDEVYNEILFSIETIEAEIEEGTEHIAEGWDSLRGMERLTMDIRERWPDMEVYLGGERVQIVMDALYEVYNIEMFGGQEQMLDIETALIQIEEQRQNP